MRQRVALARTMMEDRPIVLLDEPFSALDARTRAEMQELAFQTFQDKTVLLVTHDPAEAARVTRENLSRLMLHDRDLIDPLAIYIHRENLALARFNSRGIAVTNALAEALPDISARLIGIWGERDATAGGAVNIAARRDLFLGVQADAAFHVLPDVGHWAMYEAPQRVNELILEG